MSLLRKLITPFADDIMVKLMEYKEFPEEKYEIVLENKRLREELMTTKSKHYDTLLDENTRIRNELHKLREDKIRRLEIENEMLKLELNKGNNQLLIGSDMEEVIPLNIVKFVYIEGLFKYFYEDNTVRTRIMDNGKFLSIMRKIFPSSNLRIMGKELHISSVKLGKVVSTLMIELTEYNIISEIDDLIEERMRGAMYHGFLEE